MLDRADGWISDATGALWRVFRTKSDKFRLSHNEKDSLEEMMQE